jgi:ribosomal protein S18 acetylase RimI-like enzyme
MQVSKLSNSYEDEAILLGVVSSLQNDFVPALGTLVNIRQYVNKLINKAEVVVAKCDGKVAGYVAFYANYEQSSAFITSTGVMRDARGMKVTSFLRAGMEQWCRSNEIRELVCEVSSQNFKSINNYKENGYSVCSSNENQSTYRDSLFMKKYIAPVS